MKLYTSLKCTCGDVLCLCLNGKLQGQDMYLFLKCVNEECEREFVPALPDHESDEIEDE